MESLKEIIESILFVSGEAVQYTDIAEKLRIEVKEVESAIKALKEEKEKAFSGILVQTFNGKAQLTSSPNYAEQVSEVLNPIKEKALTRAVLEVAAIIAYKQPITRLEIESVRGVNSDYAVNVLIENNLIEIVGRKDAIGKPLLYGTTDEFLKRFNLESISDLPDYDELLERIKVIKTQNDSLFDFSNIPSTEMSEKEQEAIAQEDDVPNVFDKLEAMNDTSIDLEDLSEDAIGHYLNSIKDSTISVVKTQELDEFEEVLQEEDEEDGDEMFA